MGCPPRLRLPMETFVSGGKKTYCEYVKNHQIAEVLPCDIFFKRIDNKLKAVVTKIETEDQFSIETRKIMDKFCGNIKDKSKQYGLVQKLDNILIDVVKGMKKKETLQLASKLQKRVGHRLQRFRSVCGYGLSGVFMKFEIKMLRKEINEQDEIVAFVEKVMTYETDIKDKKVYDLVAFVVIGKLPVLDPDQHLKLELKEPTDENGHGSDVPSIQTVGALFRIEGEDGWYFSTCTHGKDFTKYKFKIHLEGMEPLDAQYGYALYTKLDDVSPFGSYFDEEKDVHNLDEGYQASDATGGACAMETSEIDSLLVSNPDESSRFLSYDSQTRPTASVDVGAMHNLVTSESTLDATLTACCDGDIQDLSDCEMKPVRSPSARPRKRPQSDVPVGSHPQTPTKPSFMSTGSTDESGYGSSIASTSSGTSLLSQSSIGSGSTASLTPKLSIKGDGFEDVGLETQGNKPAVLRLRKNASKRKSSNGSTISRGLSGISLSDSASQHLLDTAVLEEATEPSNTSELLDNQNPGPTSGGSTSNDTHIDLCLLKVQVKGDNESECLSKMAGSDCKCAVMDKIMQETGEVETETVRKYGITTNVTEGRVVNWNNTLKATLNGKIVWMNNMIITEQHHTFERQVLEQQSSEPLILIPDVKTNDMAIPHQNQGVNNETGEDAAIARLKPFVKEGDSGAIITTTPSDDGEKVQAIANHLYHYNSAANIYKKELNYSVSSPLSQSLRQLELKTGKRIKMMPTFIPIELEVGEMCIGTGDMLSDIFLKSSMTKNVMGLESCKEEVAVVESTGGRATAGPIFITTQDNHGRDITTLPFYDWCIGKLMPDKKKKFQWNETKKVKKVKEDTDFVEGIEDQDNDIQNEKQDNLKLSYILLKKVGFDLENIKGVCGYSLNRTCMKMKVILLQDEARERVLAFLEEEMKKIGKLKGKHISELVHIEIDEDLPMIVSDCCPGVIVNKGESEPMMLTLGLPFRLIRNGKVVGTFVSTCSHGENFKGAKFITRIDKQSQSLLGSYDKSENFIELGKYWGQYFNIRNEKDEIGFHQVGQQASIGNSHAQDKDTSTKVHCQGHDKGGPFDCKVSNQGHNRGGLTRSQDQGKDKYQSHHQDQYEGASAKSHHQGQDISTSTEVHHQGNYAGDLLQNHHHSHNEMSLSKGHYKGKHPDISVKGHLLAQKADLAEGHHQGENGCVSTENPNQGKDKEDLLQCHPQGQEKGAIRKGQYKGKDFNAPNKGHYQGQKEDLAQGQNFDHIKGASTKGHHQGKEKMEVYQGHHYYHNERKSIEGHYKGKDANVSVEGYHQGLKDVLAQGQHQGQEGGATGGHYLENYEDFIPKGHHQGKYVVQPKRDNLELDPLVDRSIDICMIELNSELEQLYYPRDLEKYVRVTEFMPVDENLISKPVQKFGAETHMTYGIIEDVDFTRLCQMRLLHGPAKGEIVKVQIRGGILTKSSQNKPNYSGSSQPSNMETNVRRSKDGGPPPKERFAVNGDSGATITTKEHNGEVKAISKHLYSIGLKGEYYSLSCLIQAAKKQFEEKYKVELSFPPNRLPNYQGNVD